MIGVGYIVLARRMYESDIPAKDVRKIIKEIDFSRNNEIWVELGILDEKGNIDDTSKTRKNIRRYFEELKL